MSESPHPLTDVVQNERSQASGDALFWWANRYQAMLDHARRLEMALAEAQARLAKCVETSRRAITQLKMDFGSVGYTELPDVIADMEATLAAQEQP